MNIKKIFSYLWKLPLCGVAFFIGMAIGGGLLPALGLPAPEIPAGTDANTIALWFLLGSLLLGFALSFVSRNIAVKGPGRWLILAALIWGIGAIGMVLESIFFMDTGAVSSSESTLFTILNFLLPSIFLSGMVTQLFRPAEIVRQTSPVFSTRDWALKILLVLLAYPLIYFTFGILVQPFVMDYYTEGMYELAAPTWGQLIPLQLARGGLFLLVCLPVIHWWQGSRRSVWLSLGFSFFVLTAFMAVITAYWFPWQMRLFHGLELLADGVVYTGVLVWLFIPTKREQSLCVSEMERKEPEYA